MQIAGLMSGTSLDGLTIAQISMLSSSPTTIEELRRIVRESKFVSAKTYKFPASLRKDLAFISEPRNAVSTKLICRAGVSLGRYAASCLEEFVKKVSKTKVDLVGFHGQTVYHEPGTSKSASITYQIGDPSPICYGMNVPIVSDFRSMDTAAGGQGAPLVPMADYLRYSNGTNRVIINIGGIANVTFLPKGRRISKVRAFDVGPGNILIDGALNALTNSRTRYDKDGKLAMKGRKSTQLFNWISERDDFRFLSIPKSTGRERYDYGFTQELVDRGRKLGLSAEDLIATISSYTVFMIEYHLKYLERTSGKIEEIIVGGGGTKNKFIMENLTNIFRHTKVSLHDDYGIPAWCWESVAFAILAHLTFNKVSGNVISATGAKKPVVLGRLNYPPRISLQ
jgi:anhydro-N-acetylmuramic acid kinase